MSALPSGLLAAWGLEGAVVERVTDRVHFVASPTGDRYTLKHGHDVASVRAQVRLLATLPALGYHLVPHFVPDVAGEAVVEREGRAHTLHPRIAGRNVGDHFGASGALFCGQYGREIARLHLALARHQSPALFPRRDIFANALAYDTGGMGDVLDASSLACVAEAQSWLEEMRAIWSTIPQQLIHRDTHPSNMLFDGDRFAGFLDFELVGIGPRLVDPCYCATSLLVAAYPDPRKLARWPALEAALLAGYESIRPLAAAERESVRAMMVAIQIVFVGYFVRLGMARPARDNAGALCWLWENDCVR